MIPPDRPYFYFNEWLDETSVIYRNGLLDVVEWPSDDDATTTPMSKRMS